MALDFALLTEDQIWGADALDVIKRYGIEVAPTDLAVLLGNVMERDRHDISYTSENERACIAWTLSQGSCSFVRNSYVNAYMGACSPQARFASVRPVLSPNEAQQITPTVTKKGVNGIDIALYGEYPQTVADEQTTAELENLFHSGKLQRTGKVYTFDFWSSGSHNNRNKFSPTKHFEYEYHGQKYILVSARSCNYRGQLHNGDKPKEGKSYWIRVEPIEWLVDKSGTWVSKKALLSGIQFDTKCTYNGKFEKTFMKRYLNTYFAKEIIPSDIMADKERKATIEGLKAKLTKISNLEQVKKTIKPASTAERTETLARIMRVRRAKEILSAAAKKAQATDNEKLLQEIMEIAKPYAMRDAVLRSKSRQKRLEHRAKKGRE